MSGETYTIQTINVPLNVGSFVELYEDVDMDEEKGMSAGILFEGTVAQYVPETGLLRFEENDVGRAEFLRLLDACEGYQVIRNP